MRKIYERTKKLDIKILSVKSHYVSHIDYHFVLPIWTLMQSGGPSWEVQTGRRDSLSASKGAANNNIPGPNSNVATLLASFQNVGLSLQDMVALSGNLFPFCLFIYY